MTSTSELQNRINELKGARVLVVGDLMLDTYLLGNAARISPEAPVPVVRLEREDHRLGGAANCAMNIAALGGVPILMGAIGNDESGERFLDIAIEREFSVDGVFSCADIVTTHKVRVVADGQQIVRLDEESKLVWPDDLSEDVLEFIARIVPDVDAVAVSDYAKGFVTADVMTALHDHSRQANIPVLVDPKPVNAALYKGCDLMKPNRKEAVELSGIDIVDDRSCDAAALNLMYTYSPRALLVTRGPDGMDLYREDSEPVRIRANVSRVYDVSGAGDTVLATLAMAWAKKFDPVDACTLAAAAAAVAVTKPGTSTVSAGELLESIGSFR